jgi:predicted HTH domain antitoxin
VPDELVSAIDLPGENLSSELLKEMALGLYQRRALSAGKAAQLAGLPRWEFEQLLSQREIVRPFSIQDLQADFRGASEAPGLAPRLE